MVVTQTTMNIHVMWYNVKRTQVYRSTVEFKSTGRLNAWIRLEF